MQTHLSWLPAVLLALGGCRLIDQRTFERAPQGPTPAALARPVLPPLPLVRLQPSNDPDWRTQLDTAVQAVLARNPDAHFDLLTPIPVKAKRDVQDGFAHAGTFDAQMVAKALEDDRIDPTHITIGFQGDAGSPTREVRLYAH